MPLRGYYDAEKLGKPNEVRLEPLQVSVTWPPSSRVADLRSSGHSLFLGVMRGAKTRPSPSSSPLPPSLHHPETIQSGTDSSKLALLLPPSSKALPDVAIASFAFP